MLMRPIQAQSRCAEYAPMGLTFTTLGLGSIGVLLHGFLCPRWAGFTAPEEACELAASTFCCAVQLALASITSAMQITVASTTARIPSLLRPNLILLPP